MRRIIFDLDGTLTEDDPTTPYADKEPNWPLIAKLHEYHAVGFEIVIATARNMRTYDGNIGKINLHTLPTVLSWLEKHRIPFDEIYIGKPWCGTDGFYVDDRAIRPDEFCGKSYQELRSLVGLKD